MERSITRDEFSQAVSDAAAQLATEVWATVVDAEAGAGADTWLRQRGGAFLREVLGAAWSARAERVGVSGRCACGGTQQCRQRRPMHLRTVLPGRDVGVRVLYGQCDQCHTGVRPLLTDLEVDAEGFTRGLQELAVAPTPCSRPAPSIDPRVPGTAYGAGPAPHERMSAAPRVRCWRDGSTSEVLSSNSCR